jgi:hypothetical protein
MPQSRIYNPFVGAGGGGGGGEANTGSNVGTGQAIFRDKTGVVLNFKTLVAGSNIVLTPSANELQISATGEANTGANVGNGENVFRDKTGTTLNFKTITAGSNIILTPSANELQISAIGGGGEANDGSNVGTGVQVYKNKTGVTLNFKTLIAGSGMTITPGTDEITFSATGGGGSTTLIAPNGNLIGTYNGDVYCQGDVNVTGAVTILGDLHVVGNLLGSTGSPINVRGSVKILGRINIQCSSGNYQNDITIGGDLLVMSKTLQSKIQANLLDNTVPCHLQVDGNVVIYGLDAKPLTDAVSSVRLTVGGSIYGLQPNFENFGVINLVAGDYISGSSGKAGGDFFVRGDVVALTVNTSGQSSNDYGGDAGDIIIGGSFIGENYWPYDPVLYPNEFPYNQSNDPTNRVTGADLISRGGDILSTSGGPFQGGDAGNVLVGGDVLCRDFIVRGGGFPIDDYTISASAQIIGGHVYDVQINGNLVATRDVFVKPGDALGGEDVGLYKGSSSVLGNLEFINCRWWPSLGFDGQSALSNGTDSNYPSLYVRGNIKGINMPLMNDIFLGNNFTADSDGTFYNPTQLQVDGNMDCDFVSLDGSGNSNEYAVGLNGISITVKGNCYIDTLNVQAFGASAFPGLLTVKGDYRGNSISAQYSSGTLVTEGTTALDIDISKNCYVSGINLIGANSNTDTINGKNGGSITIGGDCFALTGLRSEGGDLGTVSTGNAGNGGTITIKGSYRGGYLISYGGQAESDSGSGGNGGSIIIDGDCIATQIRVEGRDNINGSVQGFGGNGGTITIKGNAILSNTTSIQMQGGHQSGPDGRGGAGGSLTVEGDLIANNILGFSEENNHNSLNAHHAGSITVNGNCRIGTATLTGGNTSTGSGKGGNGGNVTVRGVLKCTNLVCTGGNSDNDSGGNGGNITLLSDVRADGISANAGSTGSASNGGLGGVIDVHGFINATSVTTKGGESILGTGGKGGNQTYRGGFNINTINCEDGAGGSNTGTVSLLMRGHCTCLTITSTNKTQTRIRPIDANTVCSFTGDLVGRTVLFNGGNTVATGAFINTNYYWHRGNVWYRVAGTAA